jgi:hypothetical protein
LHSGSAFRLPISGGWLTLGAYFTSVSVLGESFTVLVDTGSSNLLLPASDCESCGANVTKIGLGDGLKCDTEACKRCSVDGSRDCLFTRPACDANGLCHTAVSYGGGSSMVTGFVAPVQVDWAGFSTGNVSVTAVSAQLPGQSFGSGLLGLAFEFNACNPTCVEPLFRRISRVNKLPYTFGICLTGSAGGQLDLGGYVPSRMTAPFIFVDIVLPRWFNFGIQGIRVGADPVQGLTPSLFDPTNDVIGSFTDSGTSIVLMGPLIFQQVVATFSQSYCHLPFACGKTSIFATNCVNAVIDPSAWPAINFVVQDNQVLTLPASSYLMVSAGTTCLAIASVGGLGVILGDAFMQNYYIFHDMQGMRLGFSPLAQGSCV